ncbi:MAG: PSD1 domain-containing protein [Planctomycetales bacterium]|nr:PSD1 domain-containing protein [Planctomycetales bacterium]
MSSSVFVHRSLRAVLVVVFAGALVFSSLPLQAADDELLFETEVRPLILDRCTKCHNDAKSEAGLSLQSRDRLLSGGDSGPAIDVEQPAASLLLRALRHQDGLEMPPDGRLSSAQIDAFSRWISAGAPWDIPITLKHTAPQIRSGPPTAAERRHWAFRPIVDPAVPHVDSAWIKNDVDAFVLSRLQQAGLKPHPAADRSTWLRRATFDLTGLPPSYQTAQAFAADSSADAYQTAIERLLESPAYGERWGRHWLDVVRYADTAGETGDYPTPNAYKYRNWVIDAFNQDLPYDEFIRQQVAGDILGAHVLSVPPMDEELRERRDMLIATGFIAISRRFGFDVENYHHLTIQDTIDTLGQAVLGLSLGCARCHDHKFDPISMRDYYGWYGIFASTRYSFPGSEEKKRPYDVFAISPADGSIEVSGAEQAARADGIYGAIEKADGSDSPLQLRGDPAKLGDIAARRNLELLGADPISPAASSGRADLARWLTRDDNPLTARVIVNRVWQQHFGRGLVASVNDFGARGDVPSHPELLDWLTSRFIESGWSIKALHRVIMNSATYQQASLSAEFPPESDSENRLLSYFARRRLSAEELRDAMLSVSGRLDASCGEAHPFPAVDTWGFTQHSPFYAEYPTQRRSVYLMQQRLKRHPFLALFDGADPNSSTGQRELTTVPTQTLFLMNSDFVHQCAEQLATACYTTDRAADQQTQMLYRRVLARDPSSVEATAAIEFTQAYRQELLSTAVNADAAECDAESWRALARTLLVRNEFLFVE